MNAVFHYFFAERDSTKNLIYRSKIDILRIIIYSFCLLLKKWYVFILLSGCYISYLMDCKACDWKVNWMYAIVKFWKKKKESKEAKQEYW